jgi:hypothetical protein
MDSPYKETLNTTRRLYLFKHTSTAQLSVSHVHTTKKTLLIQYEKTQVNEYISLFQLTNELS